MQPMTRVNTDLRPIALENRPPSFQNSQQFLKDCHSISSLQINKACKELKLP